MKQLTVKQVYEILKNNKYVILTDFNGVRYGVNGGVVNLKKNSESAIKNAPFSTRFISWYACNFMEYLTEKNGFL